jgi:cation diffusion facilitator family transporter
MSDHDHVRTGLFAGRREARLLLAALLTTATLVAETIGGLVSGSLALLADAGHMLVDSSALLLAWLGARFASRPTDARRSYGYARLEVLAGFVNALTMFVLVGWIVWEAVQRMRDPAPILSGVMLLVALGGLIVNLVVLRVLGGHAGHAHGSPDRRLHDENEQSETRATPSSTDDEDLNVHGARLHVIGDLLGSLAAVLAALVVRYTGWTLADPILSVLVALLILVSSWRLLRRTGHILLEGVPEGINADDVAAVVGSSHAAIRDVHHVHLWMLGSGARVATLHLRIEEVRHATTAQAAARKVLRHRFGIDHATIQVDHMECTDSACEDSDRDSP